MNDYKYHGYEITFSHALPGGKPGHVEGREGGGGGGWGPLGRTNASFTGGVDPVTAAIRRYSNALHALGYSLP